jgi:hypothetical protein
MIGESRDNPLNMRIVGTNEPGVGKLVIIAALTLAPVAVAILMQNPALRQAIEMKAWNMARIACRKNARMWANLESIAATRYDVARL